MEITFSKLSEYICGCQITGRPYLIGIDGMSAAGKSTFSERLGLAISDMGRTHSIIPMDDLFSPEVHQSENNSLYPGFDMKWIKNDIIDPLKKGVSVSFQRYDKVTKSMAEWRDIPANAIIILEGIFTTGELLGNALDLRLWVECPREKILDRADERSGPGSRDLWEVQWLPAEEAYITREISGSDYDLTIDGTWQGPGAFESISVRNTALKNWLKG